MDAKPKQTPTQRRKTAQPAQAAKTTTAARHGSPPVKPSVKRTPEPVAQVQRVASKATTSHPGITRRALIGGAVATGVVASVAVGLSKCHRTQNEPDGTPQYVEDSSATNITKAYEQKSFNLEAAATWQLPLGTVLHAAPGVWRPALAQGDTAAHMLKACALSTTSGELLDVVTSTQNTKATWLMYDARCSDKVFAWVELDTLTRSWVLYGSAFADGALTGKTSKLWEADANYDPPSVACWDECILWQVTPAHGGSKTSESSFCYLWQAGDKQAEAKIESPGRFATPLSISGDCAILSPRVNASSGTYYGITAYDLRDKLESQIERLVLPQSIRPFFATRVGDKFVFSVEANYASGGLFGKMGTYIGGKDGPFVYLSREPAAQVSGTKAGVYAIKSGASYFIVNTQDNAFDILTAANRSLDYGEYPASEGESDMLVTYSTVKDQSSGYPSSVVVRAFKLEGIQTSS